MRGVCAEPVARKTAAVSIFLPGFGEAALVFGVNSRFWPVVKRFLDFFLEFVLRCGIMDVRAGKRRPTVQERGDLEER
jgi:hypothetical protein